jgi:hypothetical protein
VFLNSTREILNRDFMLRVLSTLKYASGFRSHLASYPVNARFSSFGGSEVIGVLKCVATIHLHLVPRLRMSGALLHSAILLHDIVLKHWGNLELYLYLYPLPIIASRRGIS